jgi:prepilin-type N-terminal cleavage/methylation domain-containing protein
MTGRHQQKGFSLVELTIVMVVIGLMIGGILKGQALFKHSRVTATIEKVSTIAAAAKTFKDTYGGLPGDLADAPNILPDCLKCGIQLNTTPPPTTAYTTPCTGTADGSAGGTDGSGNKIIGSCQWDMVTFQSASYNGCTGVSPTCTPANETVLFWLELTKAGLFSGITDDGVNNIPASFGGSLPTAPIGGGFMVGYANAARINPVFNDIPQRGDDGFFITSASAQVVGPIFTIPHVMYSSSSSSVSKFPIGNVLILALHPATLTATVGDQVISPVVASEMDLKIDDGMPDTGLVEAYGAADCHGTYAPSSSNDCGLYIGGK